MKGRYYEIEPYQIRVSGMPLTVFPMDDGVYKVCAQHEVLAHLYPEITAAGIYWNAFGQIKASMAEEIGLEIYACEI
jgi:hypothetical protein